MGKEGYSQINARLHLTSDNKNSSYEVMLRELAEQNAVLDFEGEEDAFMELNEWLVDNANNYEKVTPEMATMYADEFIDNLQAIKEGRLDDVRYMTKRNNVNNYATTNRGKEFENDIQKSLSGQLGTTNAISLGKTPKLLIDVGLENKQLLYTQKHLHDALKPKKLKGKTYYHGLTVKQLVKAVEQLDSPTMIFDSWSGKRDTIIVVTDVLDDYGDPIIISIKTGGKGQYNYIKIESNFVTSIYGKEKFHNFVETANNNGDILYANKAKSQGLNASLQVSFLQVANNLSFDSIIRKSNNVVKKKNDSEGKELTPGQQSYFADSKVRDEEGNLLVVYHGTNNNFTIFDLGQARDTEDIEAFFFSGNKEEAEGYGDTQKYYLNIINPADYNTAYDIFFDYRKQKIEGAGAKAREELIRRGYDGVIAENEDAPEYTEYLAFYPEQIKLVSNENPTENEDIRYMTKRNASEEMQSVIERLSNNEAVSIEEIINLKEIKDAYIRRNEIEKNIGVESTKDLSNREFFVKRIIREIGSRGSFSGFENVDGKVVEVYNGDVRKDKRLDIVIGLPAAGKSSVLVNPLSEKFKSKILDNDMVKEMLPEFNEGYGASLVHEESQDINQLIIDETMKAGENIVIPIVGANYDRLIKKYIAPAKNKGYSVYVHLNELPMYKAESRLLTRFIETGRFLPPELIISKYHNKPSEVYERLKKEGVADGYSKYSNDVKFGEEPIFTEGEDLREFIRRNNDRKRDAKTSRNNAKELHNGIRLEETEEEQRQSKRNSELATNRELVAGVIKQLAKNDKENQTLNTYVKNIDEITKALDRVDEINLELRNAWLHREEAEEAKALKELKEEKEALLDKVARQDKKIKGKEDCA